MQTANTGTVGTSTGTGYIGSGAALDDVKAPKKRGRPPKKRDGDGQVSVDPVAAGEVIHGESEASPRMTWAEFDKLIYKWEFVNKQLRLTRVYFDGPDAIPHYVGCYSEATVSHGEPGWMLSSGETVLAKDVTFPVQEKKMDAMTAYFQGS